MDFQPCGTKQTLKCWWFRDTSADHVFSNENLETSNLSLRTESKTLSLNLESRSQSRSSLCLDFGEWSAREGVYLRTLIHINPC